MRFYENFVSKALVSLSRGLNLQKYEHLLVRLIRLRSDSLAPSEALRFLFRLDPELYSLQGPLSIDYNGGEHTKHRHTRYHDFFVERVRQGEHVLDVGCGAGRVTYDLVVRAGAVAEGIDYNEESIAKAKEMFSHPNLTFRVQDALTFNSSKLFDTILLSNVLEHLNDRPAFLKGIVELTNVNRVLVRVPSFERDWRVPLKKELGVEWRLDPDHKTEYTEQNFLQEIKEAGLKITFMRVRWGEILAELVV